MRQSRIGQLLLQIELLDPVELERKRWAGVSKEERSAILRRAVNARWAKARKAKNPPES